MILEYPKTTVSILVTELTIKSEVLKRNVVCTLYLPEMENVIDPLHLLLINDGQDLVTMKYNDILQDLYRKNLLLPVLTVGIKAGDRLKEYGIAGKPDFKDRGILAEAYSRFITTELLPAIYAQTGIEKFSSCAIAGFSLGGLSAFDIAWNNPDVFSKVGTFSGSFWWRHKNLPKKKTDSFRLAHKMVRESAGKPGLQFWFEAGTQDETSDRNENGIIDSIDDTTSLMLELYKKGYQRDTEVRYIELIGGKHDVPTWGKMMPKFLTWAFGK